MSRVPTVEQWTAAFENLEARQLCFEAIGYARGYCDALGLGSGDAVDFGLAYAVLVFSRRSRPSIDSAWRNWLADIDIAAFPGPR